mgnify:CR=1 FL=1
MSTITYTKSGINVSASVSIKKNGDATERCLTNCTGQVNGITTSDVDILKLPLSNSKLGENTGVTNDNLNRSRSPGRKVM